MDSVRSAALGFWIGTGSAGEDDSRAGLSHLIEHMLFRGTEKYGSLEIDQLFDAMGAELNAGTGKETTSVYARVLDVHVPKALDVIADMVWRPRFADDDLANERQIVLEEIAMYEDDPQDKVFDVLGEAVFHGHPLGRAIIGRADVVAGTPARGPRGVPRRRATCRGNVVVAAAGLGRPRRVRRARARDRRPSASAPCRRRSTRRRSRRRRACASSPRTPSRCTSASAPPASPRDDERRYALRVLDAILGGTSSSRLFQEVREKRGLAYAVYSFQSLFARDRAGRALRRDAAGQRRRRAARRRRRARARCARTPCAADELARAKENVKGRVVLGLESTLARMNRLGSSLLAGLPLLSVDEVMARIDAVTRRRPRRAGPRAVRARSA